MAAGGSRTPGPGRAAAARARPSAPRPSAAPASRARGASPSPRGRGSPLPALQGLVLSLSAALPAGARLAPRARLLSILCASALFGAVSSPLSLLGLRAAGGGRSRAGRAPFPPRPPAAAPPSRWLVESPAPPLLSRRTVSEPLHTGVLVLDALAAVGRGQRELVLGDRQTGKTSVCLDALLSQESEGVACAFASVGMRASALLGISFSVLSRAPFFVAFVAASSFDRPSAQYLAPYSASALAEFFMWAGQISALVALDDLSRHAACYRETALLLRRPPGREAYPGEVFFLHSRLLERSSKLSLALGGGSVTCFPVIEALAADVSAYISTNAISITDGQPFLSLELFLSGARPAVDVGLSVSRIGSAAQWAGLRGAAGSYKIEVARFADLQAFAQLGADLGPPTQRALARGGLLLRLLAQPCGAPLALPQELLILSLSAGGRGAGGSVGRPASGPAGLLPPRSGFAGAVPGWLLLRAPPALLGRAALRLRRAAGGPRD